MCCRTNFCRKLFQSLKQIKAMLRTRSKLLTMPMEASRLKAVS